MSIGSFKPTRFIAHLSRATVLAVVMLLFASACGGGDDSAELDGVASLRDPAESGEAGERVGFEEGLLQFTACMRDNGIELPDIQVDADGQPILRADILEGVDSQSSEFNAAFLACVGILTDAAPVQLGSDPELQAAVQDALRDFSACMRENGVEGFPDPAPGFSGSGSPYPLSALDTTDPDVDDALDACNELISFPGVG